MNITMTEDALRALLFGILSCQCPVEEPVERELFKAFRARTGQGDMDLAPFLAIADKNPVRTPVHIFLEFCRYGENDPNRFAISLEHVIRYFCSLFHFRAVTSSLDPLRVPEPSAHLVGHMFLPVTLSGDGSGVAAVGESRVELRNLFLPPEIKAGEGDLLGMHFGMILAVLGPEQARVARDHLALIPEMESLAARAGTIDYGEYQTYGDHRASIAERYRRNL